MGRLSGFTYRNVIKKLNTLGFELYRQGRGSHELWINPSTKQIITIPKHPGDMPEGTLRAILKQADIAVNFF